jgi:DHA2 family multidrug resistance protein
VASRFAVAPIVTLTLGGLAPERLKLASGLFNLMRNLGGAIGIAACGTILNDRANLGRAAEGTDGGHPLTVERYPRMKPSISSDAQAIAWSMLWPCWVQRAIILVIVACEYIWVAMFVGAGAQEIEAVRSSRGG